MANFRMVSGMYIKFLKDVKSIKQDEIHQILSTPTISSSWVTLVGVNEFLTLKDIAGTIEPVYPKKET